MKKQDYARKTNFAARSYDRVTQFIWSFAIAERHKSNWLFTPSVALLRLAIPSALYCIGSCNRRAIKPYRTSKRNLILSVRGQDKTIRWGHHYTSLFTMTSDVQPSGHFFHYRMKLRSQVILSSISTKHDWFSIPNHPNFPTHHTISHKVAQYISQPPIS